MRTTVLFPAVPAFLALLSASCGGGGSTRVSVADIRLEITTLQLQSGSVGKTYTVQLTATGGAPPYAWSIVLGKLPAGLTLNASTGAVSGTPQQAGTFSFTAEVKDSSLIQQESSLESLSLDIAPPPLVIVPSVLPVGAVGQSYSFQLQASGGVPPYTWMIIDGALPSDLVLDASSGLISGTASMTGTFSFTVQVADSSAPQNTARLIVAGGLSSPERPGPFASTREPEEITPLPLDLRR